MNIDELIDESKAMPNISNGGSPAYSFGNYVLVKYSGMNEYGKARKMEEQVQIAANNKNMKGVNTPRHIAIKRVVDKDNNYCYVLQEKVPGDCYVKFYSGKNTVEEQLKRQQELLDIPLEHFIKLAKDFGELFHMGLEPQAKNLFYDKEKGFYIIDLLGYDESGINYESLSDILYLKKLMEALSNITVILDYRCKDKEMVKKSKEFFNKLQAKIYLAIKDIIPNKYRRFVLRTYKKDTLELFYKDKVINEDLTLTQEEIQEINKLFDSIINDSYEKIKSGEYQLWQIEVNEIRNSINGYGILDSYKYYPNSIIKKEEFESEYEYQDAIEDYLNDYCLNKFYELVLNDKTNNQYIINVQIEIQNKKTTK